MPIRINLLAEAQAAEEMRRKCPVKRSIWIGSFVVALALIGAMTLQFKISAERSNTKTLQANWKSIEDKVKAVDQHRKQTRELESKLAALDQFTTNRMLWASVLNALQSTTVDNVQVVRLKTEQNFIVNEGSKPRTNDGVVIPGKPSTVTERVTLSIDGRDFSPRAEQVPRFKESLVQSALFAEHLQKTNKVQLTSLTVPQTEGSRQFVGFAVQLFFQEKERRLYE